MLDSTRPLWQRFTLFLLPLLLSNILQSLSGTINSIYYGQMLGVGALAAVSAFFPIVIFLVSLVMGLASGATILVGQAWGAQNLGMVRKVAETSLTTALGLGLAVALLGAVFIRPLMDLLGAPADIVDMATDYGRLMFFGVPGLFVFVVLTSMLRGLGDTLTPLVTQVIAIGFGLVVTPALIQGWFGLPRLGVLSAAVAFVAGFILVLLLVEILLLRRQSPLAVDRDMLRHLGMDWQLLGLILKLGIPAGISMLVASASAIVVVGIVNRFGSDATAAYGAVNQVISYVQFPAVSIGLAASILAAQAIGARNVELVRRVTVTAVLVNTVLTGTLVLLVYLFSRSLVGLFIVDARIVDMTETLLHITTWSVLILGYGSVLSSVMRASGDVWIPMLLSLAAILGVEVPGAIVLSSIFGLNGVWVAYCLSFCSLLLFQAIYYFGFWRRKEISALV